MGDAVTNEPETVEVMYAHADGLHFFVGKSEASEGLCVAHPDMEVAFNEATLVLNLMSKFAEKNCVFTPMVKFADFKEEVDRLMVTQTTNMRVPPQAKMDWRGSSLVTAHAA
jgi:hypothetical protein